MSDFQKTEKGNGSIRRKRESAPKEPQEELKEKVVCVNRCAKVVKGGRRFSFAALVVVGDQKGRLGVGHGKAKEVSDAIKKATDHAKKNISSFCLKGTTIPHMSVGESDGGRILLRPAALGTGVIAGGGARAVLETLGVKDILTKSLGSNNDFAIVNATLDALRKMRTYDVVRAMRTAEGDAL